MPIKLFLIATLLAMTGCSRDKVKSEAENKTVIVWAHEGQPAEKQTLQSLVDEFNRSETNIQVHLDFKQEQGYGDRVNAAAIAGHLPDIMEVDGPYTAHFAALGVLQPLNGLLPAGYTDDFMPTIIRQGTFDGKLYTLGAFESTVALFFNRDLMADCGITPPETVAKAWSWDEFMDVLDKVHQHDPTILPLETFLTWGGEWLSYAFMPVIWSNDGSILAPDGSRATGYLNSVATVEALQAWQNLFTLGYADPNATPGRFERGEAAMALGVFNRWPIYKTAGVNFGMAPYPGLIKSVSPSGSWCWGITAACHQPRKAAQVLRMLLNAESAVPGICRANGGAPARVSALSAMPDYRATRGLFLEQLRHTAQARPATPAYGTVTMELSRALADIARGADVQRALDGAARRIDAVLPKLP